MSFRHAVRCTLVGAAFSMSVRGDTGPSQPWGLYFATESATVCLIKQTPSGAVQDKIFVTSTY